MSRVLFVSWGSFSTISVFKPCSYCGLGTLFEIVSGMLNKLYYSHFILTRENNSLRMLLTSNFINFHCLIQGIFFPVFLRDISKKPDFGAWSLQFTTNRNYPVTSANLFFFFLRTEWVVIQLVSIATLMLHSTQCSSHIEKWSNRG